MPEPTYAILQVDHSDRANVHLKVAGTVSQTDQDALSWAYSEVSRLVLELNGEQSGCVRVELVCETDSCVSMAIRLHLELLGIDQAGLLWSLAQTSELGKECKLDFEAAGVNAWRLADALLVILQRVAHPTAARGHRDYSVAAARACKVRPLRTLTSVFTFNQARSLAFCVLQE